MIWCTSKHFELHEDLSAVLRLAKACELQKPVSAYLRFRASLCCVHSYGKPRYGAWKNITEINEARISKAKIGHKAMLERGDRAQCQTVPDQINHEHHGTDLNTCYNQFTRVLADDKKEELNQRRSSVRVSTGSSMTSDTASLFKGKYDLCKKGKV